MLANRILEEVITLPEAATLAGHMGYTLDRSNLLRHARSGRLLARKSEGTWLTTRAAVQALVLELATETRGRPRRHMPDWADVQLTPELLATLDEIDSLRAELEARPLSEAEKEKLHRELTIEAIYHTNHIEGNSLTLPEVRAIVEAFWVEQKHDPMTSVGQTVHEPAIA